MNGPRRLFVAGASGAVGRTLLRLAAPEDALVPHLRPTTAAKLAPLPPHAAVLELSDEPALLAALEGCTTVLQLIGTMRRRFASGDTYASSDVGTTRQLVAAARAVGVDHFVLLSSVGAGRPLGAYLRAKAEAEALVTGSGLPFTVFRPSAFEGEGHAPPAAFGALTRALQLTRWQPIPIEALARTLLDVARQRSHVGEVLEGRSLWDAVSRAAG